MFEDLCISIGSEVTELLACADICQDDAIDDLAERPFTILMSDCTTEVLGGDDRRCID